MANPKRRVRQHIMEDQSLRIVRDLLPQHWVIRDYRPDYGVDLAIELFEPADRRNEFATLGETLFVQVKSAEAIKPIRLKVYGRRNVEAGPLRVNTGESVKIDVVPLRLDTSTLLTVQTIGVTVPVMLLLVDLSARQIYFVCLNDLIEKVVIPHDPEYHHKKSRTIHIPLQNRISADRGHSPRALSTYAKRPKLYAAFEKFAYQFHELEIAVEYYRLGSGAKAQDAAAEMLTELLRHFLGVILRYDFWNKVPEWQPIGWSYREIGALHDFIRRPHADQDLDAVRAYLLNQPGVWRDEAFVRSWDLEVARLEFYLEVVRIWDRLRNLAAMYEELVREWFLPTYLSATTLTDY
jgi:hypothetical protein